MRYMIALATLIAFLGLACGGGGGKPAPTQTAAPTAAASPTAAPAAETLAFLRDGDVWLIDADGSNERQLTRFADAGEAVLLFSWLNDERLSLRVEAARDPATPPPSSFTAVLVDIAGTVLWQRELTSNYTTGYAFSPEGALVVVWDGSHATLEQLDGEVLWERAAAAEAGVVATWRSDGQLLAVRDDAAVTLVDRAGRQAGSVALHPASFSPGGYPTFRGLVWSHDGATLAFVDGEDIVVLSGEQLAEQRLTSFAVAPPCVDKECLGRSVFGEFAFAPDGRSLAVSVARDTEIGAVGNANFAVYRIDLGPPLQETRIYPSASDQNEFGSFPNLAFSPDGRWLAFETWAHLSACEGGGRVVVLRPDGSSARAFVPQEVLQAQRAFTPAGPDEHRTWGAYVRGFQWLPTSDALVIAHEMIDCSYMGGVTQVTREDMTISRGVNVVRADDFTETKLAADVVSSDLARSPSGRLLAYTTGDVQRSTIHVLDTEASQGTEIGPGTAAAWQPKP